MADDVRLTDLELIQRYSIAVRGETANRGELLATLRADLAWLQGGAGGGRRASTDSGEAATRRASAAKPVKRASAKPAVKAASRSAKAATPARRGR